MSLAQGEEGNDRLAALMRVRNLEEPNLRVKIYEMTKINIVRELLREHRLLFGKNYPKYKYLFSQPPIDLIEFGLVDEFVVDIDNVPNDFPAIVRYFFKNILVLNKWFNVKLISTIASCDVMKFYQPYQIWKISIFKEHSTGPEYLTFPTVEDVLNIDFVRYQVYFHSMYLKELKFLQRLNEHGVSNSSFSMAEDLYTLMIGILI
ncbi:hypothetical protein Dimus_029675 [Dionaea muscipula]